MRRFEYIQFEWDFGDLGRINKLSLEGWRVIYTEKQLIRLVGDEKVNMSHISLLEREITALSRSHK